MKVKKSHKSNMPIEYKETLSIHLNLEDNGGEAVELEVDVYKDSFEDKPYTSTSFVLNCYGTHNSRFQLWGVDCELLQEALSLIQEELSNGKYKN